MNIWLIIVLSIIIISFSLEILVSKLNLGALTPELPKEFKDYIKYIEDEVKVPITVVSVGPNRDETILK